MSIHPVRFAAQDETPTELNELRTVTLETIFAHNTSETGGAYVKIYEGFDAAPDGSDEPTWSHWVAAGATGSGGHSEPIPCFFTVTSGWIAVAAEAGAGLTAPDDPFEISITMGRRP